MEPTLHQKALRKMAADSGLETNEQTKGTQSDDKPEMVTKEPDKVLTDYSMSLAGKVRAGALKQDFNHKTDEKVPVGPGHTTAPTQNDGAASLADSEMKTPADDMPVMDKTSGLEPPLKAAARLLLVKEAMAPPSPFSSAPR